MQTTHSPDGTQIAYETAGSGEPIVFVPAAFNLRDSFTELAAELPDDFSTVCYDRRGRGGSSDAIAAADVGSYAVQREIEDLAAVLEATGGSPTVFGFSSGAVLALAGAAAGLPISRVVLYEPPFDRGPGNPGAAGLRERLVELITAGRNGDAVATFQTDGIGLPPEMVDQIRQSPMWAGLEAMAQTTVYDAALTTEPAPTGPMRAIDQPTLVLAGADTWPQLADGARFAAEVIDTAEFVQVAGGANHSIPAPDVATALRTFLS